MCVNTKAQMAPGLCILISSLGRETLDKIDVSSSPILNIVLLMVHMFVSLGVHSDYREQGRHLQGKTGRI